VNRELYEQILTEGGCADLSTRAKWRLSGGDRVRYLNGQVTNDVRQATAQAALHACVTNMKGKIEGDVFIHSSTDGHSLLLDAAAGLREALGLRLERYIIADDVLLEDVTEEWALWHVFGPAVSALPLDLSAVASNRYGLPGVDLWLPASGFIPTTACAKLTATEVETFRILQHIPSWPGELNLDTFPQEAGLETTAMSFTKGCYIGQEVLSRIKTTGKMPRELIAWEAVDADMIVQVGESIHTDAASTKAAGVVTSVARHPVSNRLVGLGFLRHGVAVRDSILLVGGAVPRINATIKISPLLKQ